MSQKEKFALYLPPEKKAELEERYHEDGSRSLTGFIENAVNFYLGYLDSEKAGDYLPKPIKAYLDGRLDKFEKHVSSLLYKNAVELDMLVGIVAGSFGFTEDDLRRIRAESVKNVNATKGRISFESHVRESVPFMDAKYNEDDEWQD